MSTLVSVESRVMSFSPIPRATSFASSSHTWSARIDDGGAFGDDFAATRHHLLQQFDHGGEFDFLGPKILDLGRGEFARLAGCVVEDVSYLGQGEPELLGASDEVDAANGVTTEPAFASDACESRDDAEFVIVAQSGHRDARRGSEFPDWNKYLCGHRSGRPAKAAMTGNASGLGVVMSSVSMSLLTDVLIVRNAQHPASR